MIMDATMQALTDAMQGFGITITERTRLTFGRKVATALASVEQGGKVFVWTQGATDANLLTEASIVDAGTEAGNDLAPYVATVDATDAEYLKVRPHVTTYLKTRKVAYAVSTPVKDDDDRNVGFVITRK
jgi:hypothetical protein